MQLTKTIFCLAFAMMLTGNVAAQQIRIADNFEMENVINTAGVISMDIRIRPQLDGLSFEPSGHQKPDIEIRDKLTDKTLVPSAMIKLATGRRHFTLVVTVGPSLKSFFEKFQQSHQAYIYLSDSLKMALGDQSWLAFTPANMQAASGMQSFDLTPAQKDSLIDAKSGYISVFNNSIDAGLRDAPNDSTDPSSYIDFSFAKPLFKNSYAEISGLLTSDITDRLAHVKFTPFSYRSIAKHSLVFNSYMQASLNGRETRFAAALFYSGIVPNFIDMTKGFNRLRPKPIVSAGLNMSYYSNSFDHDFKKELFAEPFIELLYLIPVMDSYTLNIQMYAYWRSDHEFKFDKSQALWNWDIALSYKVNGTAQVVGKYSYGRDDFTREVDNRLMLGFLLSTFEQ
ncbi:MAG: hypothetical protein H6695_09260 [Deferribacteres bacterium]|nr:hypothetical protein [candidate division KSB1 bacterium]MCB9510359.1 hypothetical protein [Deferribacteres bacterium]